MITLTEIAQEKIKEIAESEGVKPIIRVSILGGGCASFQYNLDFETVPKDLDETFDINGITVVIDPLSAQYIEGTLVDYKEELISSGFIFISDKIKSSCGCGNSVNF